MYSELFYRLALGYQEHYTPAVIKKLLQRFDDATDIFTNFSHKLKPEIAKKIAVPSVSDSVKCNVEREMELMGKHGIEYCFYTDDNFPRRLRACSDSPYQFFFKGSANFNYEKSVAMVGTRSASTYGKECVKHLIEGLAQSNVVIVSGLALGIDTAAHEQAVGCGLQTVAVMGTGFKRIYPSSNCGLAERILESGGTLLTEYLYDTKPDRQNFPRRNRIIAGLSDATLVVETAVKGGSIITAYIAHSYNRDVFAVPGSIFNKKHEGCHELIRKNIAAVVTSGEDVVEMMNWDVLQPKSRQTELFIQLSDEELYITNYIRERKEVSIDELMEFSKDLSTSKMNALLLGLEFKNVIERRPGKMYVCV
ncbi:MAG: DNA-processing protein DprA [Bacteroidales bacterium]|nr:DNA-processing protein DprA [Bacteroidales bacterium]